MSHSRSFYLHPKKNDDIYAMKYLKSTMCHTLEIFLFASKEKKGELTL